MNDAMYLVSRGWYRLYYGWMLLFSVFIVVATLAAQHLPRFATFGEMLGLGTTGLILASAYIVYSLTIFWLIRSRSVPLAMVTGSMLFSTTLLYGMSHTDPGSGSGLFVGAWLLAAFFIGMYGITLTLGTVLFALVYCLLRSDFLLIDLSIPSMALLAGNAVLALLTHFFWRQRFINSTDAKLNQLSVMLRSKEEQSAILIQSIADGVIVTDTSGKISLMNRTAANMTGWTVEEATSIDVQLVFKVAKENGAEISKEEYPFTAVLVHKAFYNQVLQLESRKGKKQVVSLVISPVVTSTGEVYGAVAVLRDISEQRAAEQQRGEFISTASHEMRTPVAAIEGYLALALNEKVSSIDSRARSYLEKAHASTQHLGQLFQDLLTSAKAEDGRLTSHPVPVEMGSFLEQLVEDLRFGAQKKGLSTEFAVGSNEAIDATSDNSGTKVLRPLYYVLVDPDRIREVITNIFDNAVKYTDAGKVTLGLTGNNEVVQLYIRDTGNGIPAEDVPHLFQKFYRVDNSATRTIGGTGLGLFIARKIIELYHGRIWVESELRKGSTFFINLPRLSTQKAQELTTAGASTPTVPTASPKPN